MPVTCLICGDTVAARRPRALVGWNAAMALDHVLVRHFDSVRRRGPLIPESLGCLGLEPDRTTGDGDIDIEPPARSPSERGAPDGAVLVVEDNDDVREALMALLESAGYSVRGATNGQHALELLREPDAALPCLIVLDVMMPVMNGIEFRRRQLADSDLSDLPVVIVTAYPRAADDVQSVDAAALLGKPVDLERLLDVVEARCRRV